MKTLASLLLLLAVAACAATPTYEESIRDWQAEREASLSSEDGYLALAGLHWLEDGATTFGSGGLNDWRWSFGPTRAGVFHVRGGEVTVVAEPDVTLMVEGRPLRSIRMVPDDPGPPTRVSIGDATFWVIARAGRLGVRMRTPGSDVLANYAGTERFPIDEGWRIDAVFARFDEPKRIAIPNIMGSTFEGSSPGVLVFELDGRSHRLTVQSESDTRLFVVFGDETNGSETYGGGRFLSVDLPDEEGRTTIDFNKAYNPPCAYSPYTTCPLPLPEDRLPVRVAAGERVYAGR